VSFPPTAWFQPRTFRQDFRTHSTERDSLAGYLLAWTVLIVFCSGLVGLAVSPLFDAEVPRWLILAHGIDCFLLALLALLLTRPWRQPCHGKGAATNRDRSATWNVLPPLRADASVEKSAPRARFRAVIAILCVEHRARDTYIRLHLFAEQRAVFKGTIRKELSLEAPLRVFNERRTVMLRRFLFLGVGALALAVVLGAPGQVHAQCRHFRSGFMPGFRPTPMFRFDPRFRGGMFDPRFSRSFTSEGTASWHCSR
jgi:hypothetical protein